MAIKLSIDEMKAALKDDQAESADLTAALKDGAKLKASLDKAEAAIKGSANDFATAEE